MWPAYNLQYNFTAMDENIRQEMVHADEERELYRWNGWNRKNEWNGMEFDGIEFMKSEGRKEKEIRTIQIRKEIGRMEIDRENREKEIQSRDNVIGRDKGGGENLKERGDG